MLAAHPIPPIGVAAIVVVVVGAMLVMQLWRRRQANRAASQLGGAVVTGPLPTPDHPMTSPGNIGTPNPAVPPAIAPDQRTGILTSGPPVELSVCGLPALVWQRSEQRPEQWQPMRLSLIADTSVGLPVLQLDHRGVLGALGDRIAEPAAPSWNPALDQAYRCSGELRWWGPVLAAPAVQQALLGFPIDSLSVMGGRIMLVSRDGVHLDPNATMALALVAVAFIEAIPSPQP